jgi:nicotinate-nucleotide adenylyltransferase
MSPPHRIGLFGGTFDPVHDGHIHLANLAREALALDEVRFIPCRISPHKAGSQPAAPADRLEMLHLALAGIPWAVVDDRELASAEPSYSYLTAESLAADSPDSQWFWIMGADQWQALPAWKHPEILAGLVEFIILARDGQQPATRDGYRLHIVHGEHPASATAIRSAFGAGSDDAPWVHPQVRAWLKDYKIYQNPDFNHGSSAGR